MVKSALHHGQQDGGLTERIARRRFLVDFPKKLLYNKDDLILYCDEDTAGWEDTPLREYTLKAR